MSERVTLQIDLGERKDASTVVREATENLHTIFSMAGENVTVELGVGVYVHTVNVYAYDVTTGLKSVLGFEL